MNVRGIRGKGKRKALFRTFKQNKFDIICIQESYITENVSKEWQNEWGGELFYCEGTNHSQGKVILIRKGLQHNIVNIIKKNKSIKH